MRIVTSLLAAALLAGASAGAAAEGPNVVLINPFEVKPGREAECLAMWDRAAAFLSEKPGFVSTRLHKALRPDARFGYVNVAEWASAGDFQRAVSDPRFAEIVKTDACTGTPALFQVAREQ